MSADSESSLCVGTCVHACVCPGMFSSAIFQAHSILDSLRQALSQALDLLGSQGPACL